MTFVACVRDKLNHVLSDDSKSEIESFTVPNFSRKMIFPIFFSVFVILSSEVTDTVIMAGNSSTKKGFYPP